MSTLAPQRTILAVTAPAVATAGDTLSTPVGIATAAGRVAGVSFIPSAAITGAATNNRRMRLINTGDDGLGTTVVATVQFASGTNAVALAATTLTLSATAADLVVAAGDVLVWESAAVNTGIVDPGGQARVVLERV